jgi:hypothetical protein
MGERSWFDGGQVRGAHALESTDIGMRTDRAQQLYVKERVNYRLAETLPGLMVKSGTADYIRSPGTARFSPDLDLHLPAWPTTST